MHAKMFRCLAALAGILSIFHTVAAAAAAADQGRHKSAPPCYYLPTDPEWPSDAQWNTLNKTVGERLIRGVPLARPCYGPNIDSATCAVVTKDWTLQDIL